MSFDDDIADRDTSPPSALVLSAYERRLLAQDQWSTDQLIELAFVARRLADRIDRALQSGALTKGSVTIMRTTTTTATTHLGRNDAELEGVLTGRSGILALAVELGRIGSLESGLFPFLGREEDVSNGEFSPLEKAARELVMQLRPILITTALLLLASSERLPAVESQHLRRRVALAVRGAYYANVRAALNLAEDTEAPA